MALNCVLARILFYYIVNRRKKKLTDQLWEKNYFNALNCGGRFSGEFESASFI